MAWWVNPPEGKPVSYPTRARAESVARKVKGAKVSQRKGPTIVNKLLSAFVKDKPVKLPPRNKRR